MDESTYLWESSAVCLFKMEFESMTLYYSPLEDLHYELQLPFPLDRQLISYHVPSTGRSLLDERSSPQNYNHCKIFV